MLIFSYCHIIYVQMRVWENEFYSSKKPPNCLCCWVLTGLQTFIEEGEPIRLHPADFDVDAVGEGTVVAGVLWCSHFVESGAKGPGEERVGGWRDDGLL